MNKEAKMGILSKFSLDGKVALVTGGKKGLGKAMALGFAEAGANVAVCSRGVDDGELDATRSEICQLGRRSMAIQADVTLKTDVDRMVEQVVREFGTIDILVNNAGQLILKPTLEVSEQDWDAVHATHLKGTLFCSQAAGKVMVKNRRGSIINVSSVCGIRPLSEPGGYDTAKAALIMFTTSLAMELAPHNIRVNAIAPGVMRTTQNVRIYGDPEVLRIFEDAIPLGRMGRPEEIASVALFLASEASSYMTGSTVLVDGGFQHPKWPVP
jgi:NAD(P)-dependent dehydrogenase (short-subunit alcohol dehydrogenase family)